MKKILFISAAFVAGFGMHAQNGTLIEFKIASTKGLTGSCTVRYCDFGSKTEINMTIPQMPGGNIQTVSLIKTDSPDVVYTINDKTKTYQETKRNNGQEDKNAYTVKKIGEEKIGAYPCIHALVTEGSETSEVWTTKAIPDYSKYESALAANKRMGSAKREQALKDAGCEGFSVKTVHKGGPNDGEMTMELVKLDKKAFSKTDFDLPAGYTKSGSAGASQFKSQQEIMNMSPEERAKYIEEMKKQYGKKE